MNSYFTFATHRSWEQSHFAPCGFNYSNNLRRRHARRFLRTAETAFPRTCPRVPRSNSTNDRKHQNHPPRMWTSHREEDRIVHEITRSSKARSEATGLDARTAATKSLLSALEALRRHVEPPAEIALNLKFEPAKRFALVMGVEMGLLDVLAATEKGTEITARRLSEVLPFEEDFIVRVMRLLTVQGIAVEVGIERYAPNEVLKHICTPGFKGRLKYMNSIMSPISADLQRYIKTLAAARKIEPPDSVATTKSTNTRSTQIDTVLKSLIATEGHSIVSSEPSSISKLHSNRTAPSSLLSSDRNPQSQPNNTNNIYNQSLVAHTFGTSFWQLLSRDPDLRAAFDASMSGNFETHTKGQALGRTGWWEKFPVEQELQLLKASSDVPLVVDVGGGRGHYLAAFRKALPKLKGYRLVLQDLPETVGKARQNKEILDAGIECVEHDFFGVQPAKGAHIYYLRNIIHDLSDPLALQVLTHIARAMDPVRSHLLIDDVVMPERDAPLEACGLDMLMLCLCGGKERTLREFRDLCGMVGKGLYLGGGVARTTDVDGGENIGLKVEKVWWGKHGELQPVIEVRRVG